MSREDWISFTYDEVGSLVSSGLCPLTSERFLPPSDDGFVRCASCGCEWKMEPDGVIIYRSWGDESCRLYPKDIIKFPKRPPDLDLLRGITRLLAP